MVSVRAASVTAMLALAAAPALADGPRIESTGDACNLDDLAPEVARLLHDDVATTVHVELRASHAGFEASVRFVDGDGSSRGPRLIRATSCKQLVESIAIVIAMAAPHGSAPTGTSEPTSIEEMAPPARATGVGNVPHAVEDGLALVAVPRPIAASQLAIVMAGAGGVSAAGTSAQLIAGVRWRRDDHSLGAELRVDAPDRIAVGMGSVELVRSQLAIAPCLHRGPIGMCALAVAGLVRGSGAGVARPASAVSPVLAGGLRMTWEHPLTGRWHVRAHLDADALLTTTVFDIDDMPAWRSSRVEASAGIGVLAQFP